MKMNRCQTIPGIGTGYKWKVIVGEQKSNAFGGSTNYVAPVVNSISGPAVSQSGASTSGEDFMDIQGLNFGPVPAPRTDKNANFWPSPIIYYGPQGEVDRYTASSCSVIVDDKVIRCFTVPGTGAGYWLRLVLAGQSFTKEANISYATPIVSNYKGDGAVEASTLGGERITIVGDNFGTIAASAVTSVTYGRAGTEFLGRECNVTRDQTEISCFTSPGAGTSLKWIVTIDGQQSTTPTTNYRRPSVNNIFSNPSGDGVTTETPDTFGPDGEE